MRCMKENILSKELDSFAAKQVFDVRLFRRKSLFRQKVYSKYTLPVKYTTYIAVYLVVV